MTEKVKIKFVDGPRKGHVISVEEVWADPRKRPGSFLGYSDGETLYARGGPFIRVEPGWRDVAVNHNIS